MEKTKTAKFGWLFMLAAALILIFAYEIAWYWAVGIVLLANVEATFTTTTRRSFR